MAAEHYSVQEEAFKLLKEGIINNPLHANLPPDVAENINVVNFSGSPSPSIPINWRFAESISALKGLEAAFLTSLVARKYGVKAPSVEINTDHASLFFMSTLLVDHVEKDGTAASSGSVFQRLGAVFPDVWDFHRAQATPHRSAATNIYKTKDGRFYHIHGSLNPEPTMKALGITFERETIGPEDACQQYIEKVQNMDCVELDSLINDQYKQAGTTAWTIDEYKASEHGKANAHLSLYYLQPAPNFSQPATWWPETSETSAKRPLAGLKVVDLTRIIAGPAIARGLAELGASVMRIVAPHVSDVTGLHIDMNWGKWNAVLDLRKEEDRQKLKALVMDADIFIDGYRPDVLNKYGFSKDDVLHMCSGRARGIIYVRENCYGWHGPWKSRSGWQQISDACCGVSMEFGRAMGNDEPVTPVFPNSDYCAGVAGVCGVLHALLERSVSGGSFVVETSLNYYSQWLVNSCGVYPDPVWQSLWGSHGKPVFRHAENMLILLPKMLGLLFKNKAATLFKPAFFEIRESKAAEKFFKTIKPVMVFPDGEVVPGYNVGTRTNGLDEAKWPANLMTEVIR